ncbi:MAG TPA: C25 family cysteine peptidase [Nocardioides sp.]|nr:C25 family cysteine peptidase [Nocardioides sp.]
MATRYDKLLVVHSGALRRKYGADGTARVRDALAALVAADQGHHLVSHVLDLDNASTMRALKLPRVPDGSWTAALTAVDAAAERYQPAYLALVGATDVIPQARLRNPLAGSDDDPYVPSDLPYACDLPDTFTGTGTTLLDPGTLLAVTRVVGRIPDVVGATDPADLLTLLAVAATYEPRPATAYQKVFALSAAVWRGSTTASVDALPGPAPTTRLSPTAKSPWTKTTLAPLSHFVNCHGGDFTPDWYGQQSAAPVDTVALRPEDVDGRVAAGTVVVAECCYGAMHQDPTHQNGRLPMLWAYLRSGAYAAVGASTTAYGPANGNGQADLLCRYALEGVMTGSSTGRALLDARQRYIREIAAMGPEDLKTVAQFDLLGDPSVVPVITPGRVVVGGKGVPQASLTQRRAVLRATGRVLDRTVPRSSATPARTSGVSAEVLVREAGLPAHAVAGPVRTYAERRGHPRVGFRFHVAPVEVDGRTGLVVAREADGQRGTTAIWRR